MSYNIDNTETIKSTLKIKAKYLKEFDEDNLPEDSFIDDIDFDLYELEEDIQINEVTWRSEGSGWSFDNLLKLLTKSTGEYEAVLTWEGGDSISGLRIVNGKVTQHKVKYELGGEL